MVFGILEFSTFAVLALGVAELISAACLYIQPRGGWPQTEKEVKAMPIDNVSMRKHASTSTDGSCPICLDEYTPNIMQRVTVCGHVFCAKCFEDWYSKMPRCPLCNAEFYLPPS